MSAGALGAGYVWDEAVHGRIPRDLDFGGRKTMLVTGGNGGLGFAASKIMLENVPTL